MIFEPSALSCHFLGRHFKSGSGKFLSRFWLRAEEKKVPPAARAQGEGFGSIFNPRAHARGYNLPPAAQAQEIKPGGNQARRFLQRNVKKFNNEKH
jgi:hypothetical protein